MRGDEMHLGVDILFRRRTPSDLAERFPRKTPNGSKMHFMPDAIPALAMSDGVVRFAGNTPRGWTVIIDHPVGVTSYWTHLSALLLPEVKRGVKSQSLCERVTGEARGLVVGVRGRDDDVLAGVGGRALRSSREADASRCGPRGAKMWKRQVVGHAAMAA
jgi:hypothetical protein